MPLAAPSRRGFLRGMGALLAAPAIVRASSLMEIKPFIEGFRYTGLAPLNVEGTPFYFDNAMAADLSLPGIKSVAGDYADIPRAWTDFFKASAQCQV